MKTIFLKLIALFLFVGSIAKAQPSGCATPVNLVTNPSFSLGISGFASMIPLSGACGSNSYTVAANFTNKCPGWPNTWDHTTGTTAGSFLMVDGSVGLNSQDVWRETVNVCKGKQYTFSFWARNVHVQPAGDICDLVMNINGSAVLTTPSIPYGAWTQYTATWTALTSAAINIAIVQNTAGAYRDFGIDDVFFGYCCTPLAITGNTVICIGNSTVLTASGASTYTWTNGTSTATGSTFTASPTTTTVYTVSGSDGCGCVTPNTVTVTVLPKIYIKTSGNVSICQGSSTVLSAGGGISYTWTLGTGLSSTTGASVIANPTVTTSYTVTGSNGSCTAASIITVSVMPLPTALLSLPLAICSGSSALVSASGVATNTYAWSTGATGSSISVSPTVTTTYTLYITGANGCVKASPFTIYVTPSPTITISGNPIICANTGTQDILTASGASTYAWSANAGSATTNTVSVSPGATTVYTVTGTAGTITSLCSSTATFTVHLLTSPTVAITAAPSATICAGSSVTLNGTSGSATSFLWNTGATTSSITVTPTVTTSYTLTAANKCGSHATTITVSVAPLPTVTATSNTTTICAGGSATLTATTINATSILWSTGSATSTTVVSPGVTTTYTVAANNACGSQTANVTINVIPYPTVSIISSATIICSGSGASLTAITSGATSTLWSTGASAATISVNPTVNTTYTVTASNSCFSQTATITVNIAPTSSVSVMEGLLTHICGNASYVSADLIATSSSSVTYAWSPAIGLSATTGGTVTATPSVNTTYVVTGTDSYGCTSTASILVPATFLAPADAGPDVTICASTGYTATIGTPAQAGFSYNWSPPSNLSSSTSAQPLFTYVTGMPMPITYTVYAMDWRKCLTQDVVTINLGSCFTTNINNQSIYLSASLNIAPNPNEGLFEINTFTTDEKNIYLYDIQGKLVFQLINTKEKEIPIDISQHPKGLYLLRMIYGDKVFTQKVINH